jgi:hypothetical protein
MSWTSLFDPMLVILLQKYKLRFARVALFQSKVVITKSMIPDYWLERPPFELKAEDKQRLEHLWHSLNFDDIPWLENLPVPKWVFLCWLTEEKEVVLHGSGNPDIRLFEPRAPNAKDDNDFSQQTAVFASSEGIWSIFYAILDRENFQPRFLNSAVRFELPDGWSDTRYFFSVNNETLDVIGNKAWVTSATKRTLAMLHTQVM